MHVAFKFQNNDYMYVYMSYYYFSKIIKVVTLVFLKMNGYQLPLLQLTLALNDSYFNFSSILPGHFMQVQLSIYYLACNHLCMTTIKHVGVGSWLYTLGMFLH